MSAGSRWSACWMMKIISPSSSLGMREMKSQVAAPHGFETGKTKRRRSATGRKRSVMSWWPRTMELVPGVSTRLKSRRKSTGR